MGEMLILLTNGCEMREEEVSMANFKVQFRSDKNTPDRCPSLYSNLSLLQRCAAVSVIFLLEFTMQRLSAKSHQLYYILMEVKMSLQIFYIHT
jgi:hypothetical protein